MTSKKTINKKNLDLDKAPINSKENSTSASSKKTVSSSESKYELIITEKPNAAKMIASAIADYKTIKESDHGVPYYKLTHNGKDIIVGCAVGHLFTVAEKEKSFKYPVFDLEWKETSEVDKKSFTKKYSSTLKRLAKNAGSYTVATDYDIEGEVIGLNCIRYLCKQKDASRMKFSTLTKQDLVKSYESKSKSIDWGQAIAGETRHYLDWMYGINLSRALTLSIKSTGMFKILSSGRVQGPALKLIVEKEKEIAAFKPEKYWQIQLNGYFEKNKNQLIEFWHEKDRFSNEKEAISVFNKVKGKNGSVKSVSKSQFSQKPPTPFDLTTLQMEAYRLFGIKPKQTLDIAQELYTGGFISYPRTSSQKLPKEIGYKKIMDSLSKNSDYKKLVQELSKKELVPSEGSKSDPAHPAIYPTGELPSVKDRELKIYDLIVKRFLACFGNEAKRETVKLTVDVESEIFIASGTRTIEKGWHTYYYPYIKLEEQEIPSVIEKDKLYNKETIKHDKLTQPPKRYTPASIIRELEKRNLGTKATRASIIDALYERNYIKDESIAATELGIKTVETLQKYCPEIQDEELTRHFEEEMEEIRQKKLTQEKVLSEAEKTLTVLLSKFKKNEKSIGQDLVDSHKESMRQENYIGKCLKCDGNLTIKYSPKSKRKFIGCDNYPNCTVLLNLPMFGKPKRTEKFCEQCKYPIIKILNGRRTQDICVNPDCPSKKVQDKSVQKEINAIESGKVSKICPKCGKNLVVRTSVYGQFLGCSGYPKCRHIEKIGSDNNSSKTSKESDSKVEVKKADESTKSLTKKKSK